MAVSTVGLYTSEFLTRHVSNVLCCDVMKATMSQGDRNFSAPLKTYNMVHC